MDTKARQKAQFMGQKIKKTIKKNTFLGNFNVILPIFEQKKH